MTAYEKAVIKAFLNEAYGQLCAEVAGQTIIPGYFDTDSSYPKVGSSTGCKVRFTVMINGGVKVDDETWEGVKRCVINRYNKNKPFFNNRGIEYNPFLKKNRFIKNYPIQPISYIKPILTNDKELFVNVYIDEDITKPFDITFHESYPEPFPGQTVYLI